MALELLTRSEIPLSGDPYDSKKSTVQITMRPVDSDKWTQFDNFELHVVS